MINDTSKPLVFLGSNANIFKIYELAESIGYTVAGIIDDDYHGQGKFKGIPIIAKEQDIADLRDTHQFLCVTNWISGTEAGVTRNREKRHKLINLLDSLEVTQASMVSSKAQVSSYSTIGNGVVVDAFAVVEPYVIIDDHVTIHNHSIIGHDSTVGRNTVIQRKVLITSYVIVGDNSYLGIGSRACKSHSVIGKGTFIHPHIMVLRSTTENEEVSLAGHDLRKIYQNVEIE
jgi:UDP-3-O-[3-hydroxymyristoyl] glucosamine N-acyltransferase